MPTRHHVGTYDPATDCAACLDPSAPLKHVYRNTWTTRRCRPADLGSRRSGRGDVVIVGTCFSHISSLPRGSYKFISTRRPPGVARAVDGRPRDPDLAPMRQVHSVFSTPGVRDDRLNLWSGLLARSQRPPWQPVVPQGLALLHRITFVQIRGLQALRCTGSSKLPTHRLQPSLVGTHRHNNALSSEPSIASVLRHGSALAI